MRQRWGDPRSVCCDERLSPGDATTSRICGDHLVSSPISEYMKRFLVVVERSCVWLCEIAISTSIYTWKVTWFEKKMVKAKILLLWRCHENISVCQSIHVECVGVYSCYSRCSLDYIRIARDAMFSHLLTLYSKRRIQEGSLSRETGMPRGLAERDRKMIHLHTQWLIIITKRKCFITHLTRWTILRNPCAKSEIKSLLQNASWEF